VKIAAAFYCFAVTFFVNDLRATKSRESKPLTMQSDGALFRRSGRLSMKLLLLLVIVAGVLLMSYFGKQVREEQANEATSSGT
jgi:hypothetical protein